MLQVRCQAARKTATSEVSHSLPDLGARVSNRKEEVLSLAMGPIVILSLMHTLPYMVPPTPTPRINHHPQQRERPRGV